MQLLQSAVHSRVQHLRERAEAEGLGWGGAELGAGAGAGGPGAGAGRGAAAALKTGDPQFALQCLEEYARLGAGEPGPGQMLHSLCAHSCSKELHWTPVVHQLRRL